MRRISGVFAIAILSILIAPTGADAQFTSKVFAAKFLCGFLTGDIPDLDEVPPLPRSYSGMGPGDYSTLIAAVNVGVGGGSQALTTTIAIEGFPKVTLGTQILGEYETVENGCPLIVAALESELGLNLDGQLIQGYVVVETAGDAEFEVSASYSYTARSTSTVEGRGLGSSVHVECLEPRVVEIIGD